jgi:hypothetical protein
MQFRSAPLCHPWRADRGRACDDVQTRQHVWPSKAGTPIRFLSRRQQASAALVDTQKRRWKAVCAHLASRPSWSRPEMPERGDAAARVGADGLSVGILGSCRRQSSSPVTSAGLVPIAGEAVERSDAPDVTYGDVGSLG